jgi:iron donor protein CyaY
MAALMEEKTYRKLVDEVFARIDAAFEDVDPDLAESQYSQGTLTILFPGGRRFILSPQAPVRQIWVAFKDRAWHLDLDAGTGRWLDDRGQGTELYALVEQITRETAGVTIAVAR